MVRIIRRFDAGSVALCAGEQLASLCEHAGTMTGGAGLWILAALFHEYSYSTVKGLFKAAARIPSRVSGLESRVGPKSKV
jgi:hypothetical protein